MANRQTTGRFEADCRVLRDIAGRWGTPTFVYDEASLRGAARRVFSSAPGADMTVRFAMKANPNGALLRLFDSLGLHIDAGSGFSVRRAMRAGIDPAKIQLTAQEMPDDLVELVAAGVEFNACSLHQLRSFAEALPGRGVGLRVNPGFGSGHSRKTTVGGPYAPFGIWHGELDEAAAIARGGKLKVVRIHIHVGSGAAPEAAGRAARFGTKALETFPEATVLNLGGGFPVSRMPDERAPDIGPTVRRYVDELAAFRRATGRRVRLEIEPGTYLTANSGVLLTTVKDVKTAGRCQFIVVDSGMTEILRPTLYGARHPIRVCPAKGSGRGTTRYVVVGHCCESGDLITTGRGAGSVPAGRELAVTAVGDLLVIGGAGAYCSSMSAKNYNSFPEAAEVMIGLDGEPRIIRKRQTLQQMVANET